MTSKSILIADDDRDLVRALAMRCEQLGLQVVMAYDAMNALTLAHAKRPDMVCLDVSMPHGDGLSVAEMLSTDKQLRSTPVIMLTGSSDEATIRRCHGLCAYYVLKSSDVWQRMEPVIREALHLKPPSAAQPEQPSSGTTAIPVSEPPRRGLSQLVEILARDAAEARSDQDAVDADDLSV